MFDDVWWLHLQTGLEIPIGQVTRVSKCMLLASTYSTSASSSCEILGCPFCEDGYEIQHDIWRLKHDTVRENMKEHYMGMDQYLLIPFLDIFSGMNSHLPAILMFTRGSRFWHTAIFEFWQSFNCAIHISPLPTLVEEKNNSDVS